MPGVPDNKNKQIALPMDPIGDNSALPQPRQPQNLQGLLRFAMEAQETQTNPNASSSNSVQALDEESKTFLQEALKSMTVDVIAIMQENIAKLQNVNNITDDEMAEKMDAFDSIMEYIDNIDIANDFHKINGFAIFEPCLKCTRSEIRAAVCDLIAELAQNNPYIQEVICECTNVVPSLLGILCNRDETVDVKVKALYAVSCITRESTIGYGNFKQHKGLEVLKLVLESNVDKLCTKAAFLLSSLEPLDGNVIDQMLAMDFLSVIVNVLQGEHSNSHEHLLALLKVLLAKDPTAKGKMTGDLKLTLLRVLQDNLDFVKDKDEFLEEQDYCKELQQILIKL